MPNDGVFIRHSGGAKRHETYMKRPGAHGK
jgi:hypothetical protein